jgi:ABC-type polysaccharide/polyol phosphate transport system ATPase subunit
MSTSASKRQVLRLERVNLVFRPDLYRPWSWRDTFTRIASDPVGLLLAERERLHVARDVSFAIHEGERVGLVGVNGAGKTSLCRCIAGMYHPTSGRVSLAGKARAIFDTSLGVQPELTGRENARLLARLMFPRERDPERLVDEALEFAELGKFVDMPYKQYSNGMQARLCLSLISSRPADLLILDEVFDGADAFFREKIGARVRRMIAASGAVLFVSHDEGNLRDVCNRLLVLQGGVLAFDGGVDEGLEFYRRGSAPGTA